MKDVILTTDGACSPNPGRGGWAAILTYGDRSLELTGGAQETTNNRMEMVAVIEGLNALKEPCSVTVRTDSQLVILLAEKTGPAWISGRKKKHPKNADLVMALVQAMARHRVKFEWVKGHNGDRDNERCDWLAVNEVQKPF